MKNFFSSRSSTLVILPVIVVSVLLAYSNTFHSAFQFDDLQQIVENPSLKNLGNLPAILRGLRGITFFTFALNYAAGGQDVFGYHLVNVLIHALNAVLAYFFVYLTLRLSDRDEGCSRMAAMCAALIFALHPVQTQAVTYIVQRMESLASFFYLLTMVLFIMAAKAESQLKRACLYLSVGAGYLLGFYSKEVAYTMPAAVFLYDFYFIGRGSLRSVLSRWPAHIILAVLLVYFTFKAIVPLGGFNDLSKEALSFEVPQAGAPAQTAAAPAMHAVPAGAAPDRPAPISAGFGISSIISPKEYLYTQFNVIVYYLVLLALPVNQNVDYDFPVSADLFSAPHLKPGTVLNIALPPPIVSIAIIIAILGAAVFLLARHLKGAAGAAGVVSYFIFWFFIILLPTSSFVPILDVIFEHRVYLPSLGAFVIFAVLVEKAAGLVSSRKKTA